jgi:hypothetical protein
MDIILKEEGDQSTNSTAPPSFYLLNISHKLGPEYVSFCNDVLRMMVLQVTLQFMIYLSNPSANAFISAEFLLLLLYIIIGVAMYWLVVRRLVQLQ